MALSIFTSGAAMSSTNALNKSNSILSTAMERLGTGKRINSAADDAAGLQIATRLQGQVNGMGVAQRNVSDATAMLQTAEGAFEEVTNILYRMKDLATQASNDTNSQDDRTALQAEVKELNAELKNILTNTRFGGDELIFKKEGDDVVGGKLGGALTFQIGADASETLTLNLGGTPTSSFAVTTFTETDPAGPNPAANGDLMGALKTVFGFGDGTGISGINLTEAFKDRTPPATDSAPSIPKDSEEETVVAFAAAAPFAAGDKDPISVINDALGAVGSIRSSLGANINRLGHTSANLANMKDTTTLALGNIRDADFATEATNMTRNQMLAQTSMSMLKQANSMSGMVMSLLG